MQASQTPTLVPLAFAANGTKNTIPEASQIGVTPGAASLNDGFPPLTFTPVAAGGVPPAGADFNGVLNLITQSIRWAHGGGRYAFSSTFAADANVSGYPAGAELMSADQQGAWLSLNDANTDNPDTGPGTKWVPSRAYGVTAVTGLTNANVTLTPAQAAKNRITLAGTLTGNVQITFPTWLREWTIINNTTGAFTVTAKTASGTGVAIPQNGSPTKVNGDGTNITQLAENIAPATQSQHAVQLGQQGHGQCHLAVASATTLKLSPYNGNNVIVNGMPLQLPSAGITYTISGLTANTVYYVYLAGTTASPSLVVATTSHVLGSNGVEVMSGDPAKTLVGMVYVNASTQFNLQTNTTGIWMLNWFNRANQAALNTISSSPSFTNTTGAKVTTQTDTQFLVWANDAAFGTVNGYANNNTTGNATFLQLILDGAAWGSVSAGNAYAAAANFPYVSIGVAQSTEGVLHTASLNGYVNAGTGTVVGGNLQVSVRG